MNKDNIDFNNIDQETLKEMQKLVLARLRVSSDDLTISIGSTPEFRKKPQKRFPLYGLGC